MDLLMVSNFDHIGPATWASKFQKIVKWAMGRRMHQSHRQLISLMYTPMDTAVEITTCMSTAENGTKISSTEASRDRRKEKRN